MLGFLMSLLPSRGSKSYIPDMYAVLALEGVVSFLTAFMPERSAKKNSGDHTAPAALSREESRHVLRIREILALQSPQRTAQPGVCCGFRRICQEAVYGQERPGAEKPHKGH